MSSRTFFIAVSPLQQAPINTSFGGDTTLVAGQAGKHVKVYRLKMVINAATTITIKSDTSTVLDGPMVFPSAAAWVLDFTSLDMPPWYTTGAGEGLVLNSTAAVAIGGNLDYLVS